MGFKQNSVILKCTDWDLIKSVVSLLKSSMSTPNANVVELVIMQLFRTKELQSLWLQAYYK